MICLEFVNRTVIWNQTASSCCGFRKQKLFSRTVTRNLLGGGRGGFGLLGAALLGGFLRGFLGSLLGLALLAGGLLGGLASLASFLGGFASLTTGSHDWKLDVSCCANKQTINRKTNTRGAKREKRNEMYTEIIKTVQIITWLTNDK